MEDIKSYYQGREALERYPRDTTVTVLRKTSEEIYVVAGAEDRPKLPLAYLSAEEAERGLQDMGFQGQYTCDTMEIGELYDAFPAVLLQEREGSEWHNVFIQP